MFLNREFSAHGNNQSQQWKALKRNSSLSMKPLKSSPLGKGTRWTGLFWLWCAVDRIFHSSGWTQIMQRACEQCQSSCRCFEPYLKYKPCSSASYHPCMISLFYNMPSHVLFLMYRSQLHVERDASAQTHLLTFWRGVSRNAKSPFPLDWKVSAKNIPLVFFFVTYVPEIVNCSNITVIKL